MNYRDGVIQVVDHVVIAPSIKRHEIVGVALSLVLIDVIDELLVCDQFELFVVGGELD